MPDGQRTWVIFACECGRTSLEPFPCYFDYATGLNHGRKETVAVTVSEARSPDVDQ